MIQKLTQYLKETKIEIKKVNWPTRRDTVRFTATVIFISLFIAVLLGGFDYIFRNILFIFLNK